ncbi:DNA distortion polypeptide 1 [Pseudomonas amygdali pv. morsprunorum]|uniref:DNA distortion polypeptide 1 n=1 Tax=Pseudomonas amygdali TaxID=47877 RepID=UPI00288C6EA9|nr:DNA distortion polypeptide 1 [Pseudomonas amygdali]MDT3268720.1 DNA distortion polypeptide 1 [Pseudomonas amygdali pv. morsprunorum]
MNEKQVLFRLDVETHTLINAKAGELGLTVNALAKILTMRVASSGVTESIESEENNERLRFSLSKEEKKAISYQAKANGWSMSRECRFRIVSSLSASSRLLPDELKKIRGLRAAIDTVGRNIRHMMFQSKKLEINDAGFLKEIETLNSYMAMAIKKIDELQHATVDRWGFNRKGMKG